MIQLNKSFRQLQKVSATFILCFAWIISIQAQPSEADAQIIYNIQWNTKVITTGITLKKCDAIALFNSLQSIVIVEIDTATADMQYLLDVTADYTPVSVLAERNRALVAINGTYFTSTGSSQHFMKLDGKQVYATRDSEFDTRATSIFTVTNGKVNISNWNREKEIDKAGDAQYAVVCGPHLLQDGNSLDLWDDDYITPVRHPRSCLGVTDDGKLLVVAVDGRQNTRAHGMTLPELQFFMKEMGSLDAMNLDGGGSTALYVAGEGTNGIVNVPIDGNIPGKERLCGNIMYIAGPDAPKPFSCENISPGNINGMRMWIKADNTIKGNNNTLAAPYLFDYTGYNQFAPGNNENATIQWNENSLNGYPTMAFDSASVLRSNRKVRYSTFFSVNTLNMGGTLLGFDEYPSTYSKLRYFLHASNNNVYIHDGSSGSSGTNYNYIPYETGFNSGFNVFSTSFGRKYDSFVINGKEQRNSPTNFCTRDYIEAKAQIGARNSYPANSMATTSNYFLRGEVAEIIAYPDTLTIARYNRVESYLAIKYGITMLDPIYKYTLSNGDTWWNGKTSSYTLYSNYITCITRDDRSGLYQSKAKGIGNGLLPASEALLTLVYGTNFDAPSPMESDLLFLTAGSTLDDLALQTTYVSDDVTYQLMQRHWKLRTSEPPKEFSLEILIPSVLKSSVRPNRVGVLLKNNANSVFYPGVMDDMQTKVVVSGLTAQTGDLLYLVLDNNMQSGIQAHKSDDFMQILYNPIDKTLLLQQSIEEQQIACTIYTSTGAIMLSKTSSEKSQHLDISLLSKGFYIVKVVDESRKIYQTKKLVIN